MSKFKKAEKKEVGSISTSSLPDIVFMLLFFFMVATNMKEEELMVQISLPKATEIQKIQQRERMFYIYVGKPMEGDKTQDVIQINDGFVDMQDFRVEVEKIRADKPELQAVLTAALKVDKDTKMGIVTDIKQELREAYQLKLLYSSIEGSVEG